VRNDQDDARGNRARALRPDVEQPLEQRGDRLGQRDLAEGAEEEARDRDPDLRHRDVLIELGGVRRDRHEAARQRVAGFRALQDPAARRPDGRELGRHVDGVHDDQDEDDPPDDERHR
jgi:hypothetical protein